MTISAHATRGGEVGVGSSSADRGKPMAAISRMLRLCARDSKRCRKSSERNRVENGM
jgi:hypothetical protein